MMTGTFIYHCVLAAIAAMMIVGMYSIGGSPFVLVIVGMVLLLAAQDARLST